jgi:hypothetical protein
LNVLKQYLEGPIIQIKIQNTMDSQFIASFVFEYKNMIKAKKEQGESFLEEVRTLKLLFTGAAYLEEEDFDLLFLSYLTLFKLDFPNVEIEFHFAKPTDDLSYLYKLSYHKSHLQINAGTVVFRIFNNNFEFNFGKIAQSVSFIPPLVITKDSLGKLFQKKEANENFKTRFTPIIKGLKNNPIIVAQQREPVYSKIQDHYIESRGPIEKWTSTDLSNLYMLKTLSELYLLRHFANSCIGVKSNYQIGTSISESRDDKISANKFREIVLEILQSNGFFEFSDMEVYIFSIVVHNSELFKIPSSVKNIYKKIEPLMNEDEKMKAQNYEVNKNNEKYLKSLYIEIYARNLQRIIIYTKEIVYGLLELAKNIVEHSQENGNGYGIISARIYSLTRVKKLKNISQHWLSTYDSKHKFIDINIIDSGQKSVTETYISTLNREYLSLDIIDEIEIRNQLKEAYANDIKEVGNYGLNNFFNFDSLKLFHQINRTKARLGLLIFSQTILHDKNAFVSLSSNNIDDNDNTGFFLYNDNNQLLNIPNIEHLVLGTNFNFIIPIGEVFKYERIKQDQRDYKSGSASSVFQELHNFSTYPTERKIHIKKTVFERSYTGLDKYSKLQSLVSEIGPLKDDEILLIDAKELAQILENSSDWIRFLAAMQFTTTFVKDIIILNFDTILFQEFINILKLFSMNKDKGEGFWKNDRYILFFLPVKNDSNHAFWFNCLLYSTDYNEFLKINQDIDLYHHNLARIIEMENNIVLPNVDYESINSNLFSKNKKLLNFELIIKNNDGITLFEQTLKSLLQVNIKNSVL